MRYSTRRFEVLYRRPKIRSIAKTSVPSGTVAAVAVVEAAVAKAPELGTKEWARGKGAAAL